MPLLPHKLTFNLLRSVATLVVAASLSACVSNVLQVENRGNIPVPAKLISQMKKNNMAASSPVLIRIFKQESELEVWKQDASGKYALLKTYPMCRWSGKLGPKKTQGDRQAPEGFYHVTTGRLNPKSQYYLSFDLGYPNRLENALGYEGSALMVHGACSSSGCYAITDEQVAEVYALVRDSLKGGQNSFQVQALPFRMTEANLQTYRSDENFAFWQDLKHGYDIFEQTKKPPVVSYCEGRYKFGADGSEPIAGDPLAKCPKPEGEELLSLAEEESKLALASAAIEDAITSQPLQYEDGGMHPTYRAILKRQGPGILSQKSSLDAVPVSRPRAALADPYIPKKTK